VITATLKEFLDAHGVRYVMITHSRTFTASEIAASAHVPGHELAKTVIVWVEGRMAMVVLRATTHIDIELLRDAIGIDDVHIAEEGDFRSRFPGCELGAMPPFGNLYGMDVFVDEGLISQEMIAFNAGTHVELVKLAVDDFVKLVEPKVVRIAAHAVV